MRKKFKKATSILLVCLFCICSISPCAASSQGRRLLNTQLITDGFENITVNEDGSWTVTGNFSLSFPVSYDYRMEQYYLYVQSYSDGTYDFEVDFTISDDTVMPSFLIEEYYGIPVQSVGELWSFDFRDLYLWNQHIGVWELSDYQVQCTTLTYYADTATTTTFKTLEFFPGVGSLFGDVNGDGQTDTTDIRELLFAVLGRESGMLQYIDINGDSVLSTEDARVLLKSIVA